MQKPLLIIHGWSDHSDSFTRLSQLVQTQLKRDIHLFNLADYLSMDDEVTFDDIVTAMSHAWHKHQLPTTPFSVDVIAHSTGGLIIRDWLCRNFTPETAPIKHFVMLAPANFGSPLAHKGQAFIGRITQGFSNEKIFQVGELLLQGLELASPYTWELALQDRFGGQDFYGPGKILCTVLTGDTGFTGISAAANENGTDGVVRVASANMNCAYLDADFSEDAAMPKYTYRESTGVTAFAIMAGENHHSIAAKEDGLRNELTLSNIIGGLTVTDEHFITWCQQLQELSTNVVQAGVGDVRTHGFQNSVFLVQNQFGEHVQDYFLEFYLPDFEKTWFAEIFHEDIISTTHTYGKDKGYRSLYIDCTILAQQMQKSWQQMCLSLTAMPELNRNGKVGYRSVNDSDIGAIKFNKADISKLFVPNRTLLTNITIRREQAEQVFDIHRL